ncbi:hypothetical protein ACEPTQ_24350, partial [Ralstonia wenshanensis]|uniref:hypothetical protein n=1 Tax=Ralstonia wenshanensis TaxID=2842456 RepID=UPI00358E9C81
RLRLVVAMVRDLLGLDVGSLVVGLGLGGPLSFTPCRGRLTFFVLPKKVSKERRARDGDPFLEFV